MLPHQGPRGGKITPEVPPLQSSKVHQIFRTYSSRAKLPFSKKRERDVAQKTLKEEDFDIFNKGQEGEEQKSHKNP